MCLKWNFYFTAQILNSDNSNASVNKSSLPGESSFHRSTGLLSSIHQSECSISAQFIPNQQTPSRSPTSSYIITKPFSHSTRNPINNWSSLKNTPVSNQSITDITINNNLCFTVSTCTSTIPSSTFSDSFNSHKNISASSYNHFRSFGFFYPQQRSLNECFSTYSTSFGCLIDNKINTAISKNYTKRNPNDVSSSSNCSELNSDSESIDVSDRDKEVFANHPISTSKKRNPHSIEELLKKPEKVKKVQEDQLTITALPNDDRDSFIEVYD